MKESDRAELLAVVRQRTGRVGVTVEDVEREVLAALPDDFVFRYELLWLRCFAAAVGGRPGGALPAQVAKARRVVRTSTGQTETRGGAHGGKLAGAAEKTTVANDAALAFKASVDRRLRKIARDMRAWLGGDDARAGVRVCTRCRRFGEDTWTFCPYDGQPMEEKN